MSQKLPINVAIIGCGRISGHHCRSIAKLKAVKLSAVCDLVEEKAKAYGTEFQVPYFTNYRKMFRDIPEIQVVAVVTPSGMHFEHVQEVLTQYKKHVIVEKPTFMKPSQLVATFDTAQSLGLHIFPVFQNRHNHAVCRVREGLKKGELGDIRVVSVRVRWCRPQRYYDLAPWRGTFAQDGGALTNQGVHHLDLSRVFGGEISRVNAVMRTLGAKIEVEDTAIGTFQFQGGAVGTLEVTTAARPIDYEASLSIVGSEGLAQIGGIAANELQVYTPEPEACAKHSEDFKGNVYGHGHEKLYQELAAFFEEGKPFSVTKEDCLGTIKLLNAFYRSDELGNWVDVDGAGDSTRLGRPDDKLAGLYRTSQLEGM